MLVKLLVPLAMRSYSVLIFDQNSRANWVKNTDRQKAKDTSTAHKDSEC